MLVYGGVVVGGDWWWTDMVSTLPEVVGSG